MELEVEELPSWMQVQVDLTKANSGKRFSFALKGEFTKSFLADCSHILNVGCGFGRELVLFKVPVVGVDLDTSVLSVAKRFGKDLLVADAHNLPFRDGMFDGVAMAETIEHVKSPLKALLEVRRVLESGGKLALQTPNRRITCLQKTEGHLQEFTKHELSRLVKDCGFYVLRRTGSTIPFIPASQHKVLLLLDHNHLVFRLWKQLNRTLSTRLTWDTILLCRKTSDVPS